jgi:anti-sigma factor RsiW
MSCGQSESWMMDALDGALGATDHQRLMAHLGTCPRCHAEWEGLNTLEQMLANPPILHPASGFVDRVEARLVRFEAQRRTLIGGLILLGAAAALCLLAVPSLLNGRNPIEAYGAFLRNTFELLGSGILLSYKLVVALWLATDALAKSMDVPLVSLLTYAVAGTLAAAAGRRALASQRTPARPAHNGH